MATVVIDVVAGTFCVGLGVVFLSFELTTLISVVGWLFPVMTSWFVIRKIWFSGLLRHRIYLQLIRIFQTIEF